MVTVFFSDWEKILYTYSGPKALDNNLNARSKRPILLYATTK